MILIGLTGKAGSGKDTVADALVEHHGFVKMSFAEPIKDAVAALLNVSPRKWEDRKWKETPVASLGLSPRRLAQTLGTEWGREVNGTDFWVLLLEARLKDAGDRVVISDVRFDNEARWVNDKGGYLLQIERNAVQAIESHSSEDGVSYALIDYLMFNDTDRDTFIREALDLIEKTQLP
jgi:hypothetical protein